MKPLTRLASAHAALCNIAEKLCSPVLLFVRLYWGWQFAQTGWGKLHHQAKVVDFFTSLNIPFPALNAHFVSGLEFFGGILLILGLFSRPIAFLLSCSMFVAFWTAEREAFLAIFSDSEKFYKADAYTFLAAAILIFAFGPGLFSLDALIARRFRPYMHTVGKTHWETDAVSG
ncbi:DoxX family protein [Edaphobacter modestus]|uniref:Putative oxidoreductase n=1 Tax=Edaphobacter modestus TaxID=388466 RepID=A0A4Q7YZK3_9BACT|nr:DoxX family protein [Edaphobacter modestus]RZU42954.1 putative oxidoreductase [Edaphobacter modestus]